MEKRGLYDDRAYWKQAMALKRQQFQVHYLVISHREEADQGVTTEGIHFRIMAAKKIVPSIIGNYLLKKLLPVHSEFDEMVEEVKHIQPDLIHIVDLRILRILDQIKKVVPKAKIIYDIREPRDNNLLDLRMKNWKIPYRCKKWYADYIQKWEYQQAKKCDYLLGVDDGIANRIRKNVPEMPYQTIYNFTNLATKRDYIPLWDRKYDAAYVGGLSEVRGAKIILQAAQLVAKQFPKFKLLLLGKAYDADLVHWIEQYIEQNEITENVTWIKGVPYQEVSTYYNQIKIGLNPLKNVPAHREIIQIKLFEYMNYGIPILSSNFGAMRKYVEDNEVGKCIAPDQPEALASAIIQLMTNPEKLALYSGNGYKAVDEKYNWDRMEQIYLGIIYNLLDT